MRLTTKESKKFLTFANKQGISFCELCKNAILEKIEDLSDINIADNSYQEYLNTDETVSFTTLKNQLKF